MNSRPLMLLRLTTSATEEIGSTPHGRLSIFPVIGGSFEGERLRGKVLAGGGDWVTAKADGTFELDLRVTLETEDGALIHMTFTGVRDDGNHDLRRMLSPVVMRDDQTFAIGRDLKSGFAPRWTSGTHSQSSSGNGVGTRWRDRDRSEIRSCLLVTWRRVALKAPGIERGDAGPRLTRHSNWTRTSDLPVPNHSRWSEG